MPILEDRPKTRIEPEAKAEVRPIPFAPISEARRAELATWLRTTLPELRRKRQDKQRRHEKYHATLRGERQRLAIHRRMSNLSVPMTVWAASGIRARVEEGIFGSRPIVTLQPLPGSASIPSLEDVKHLQTFIEAEMLNPRALDVRNVMARVILEVVNDGTGAWKVYREPDDVRATQEGQRVIRGRPRWEQISLFDLIYWDGYGTDTQAMPYVGHEIHKTWGSITTWATLGYYEPEAVARVAAHYRTMDRTGEFVGREPAALREHIVAELYLDFPLADDSNLLSSLLVDYHVEADQILRVAWNPTPFGIRPIFISIFDLDPDPLLATGIGVAQKLEGAQDEADVLHNLGIEAGKRSAVHLIGLRYGSQAERDLGGDDPVTPGDVYVSADPKNDVDVKPLGDASAALAAIQLEEHTRLYVMRLLGFDEARLGELQAGKRVPASLGLPILREGRVVTAYTLSSIGRAMTEALYLTLELYRQELPDAALEAAVGAAAADRLRATVFSTSAVEFRRQFVLTVNAQDAVTVQEQRKQELLVLSQFLMGFYDRIVQYGQLAIAVPPQLRPLMTMILSKLQNAVRLMLSSIESVPNADEVVPALAEAIEQLDRIAVVARGTMGEQRSIAERMPDSLAQPGAAVEQ